MEVYLAVICVTIFLIYYWSTKNFDYWKVRNVAFVKPTPLFGNLWPLILQTVNIGKFFEGLYAECKSLNVPYVGFWVLNEPCLFVRDLRVAKHVLIRDFAGHFEDRVVSSKTKNDPLGTNMMFGMKHPHWKNMRSRLLPMFNATRIKQMFEHMSSNAERLIAYIEMQKRRLQSKELDLKDMCSRFTVDNIMCSFLGYTGHCLPNAQDQEDFQDSPCQKAALSFVSEDRLRCLEFTSFFLVPEIVGWFNFKFFNKSASEFIRNLFWDAVDLRTKSGEKGSKGDFLDKLISFKDENLVVDGLKYEGDVLAAQFAVLFIAGFETSSSTMSLALHHLAWNPEKQERLRKEISETTLKYGGKITYEAINEMNYLDMVFRETIRLYPTLPFIDRMCRKDYKLPEDDLVIKKGTKVYFSLSAIQRDEQYWSDPDTFEPERFSQSNLENITPLSFVPFGEGPRICIGERVGYVQTKLGLAEILSKYRVEKVNDTTEKLTFSNRTVITTPSPRIRLNFVSDQIK